VPAAAPVELTVLDSGAWRVWLVTHHTEPAGVWLTLAKKGVVKPTSLTYDQALEEALCHGWIDGQRLRLNAVTFRQRFTPRRSRSPWSQRNVGLVERLRAEGRMHPAGVAEVERAQSDGRWTAAYAGQATIDVPADLAAALKANPPAQATFATLSSQNRYAVLYRINSVKRPETRARKIATYVDMLARGETLHPQ
jgi:uncharacterized protein YdeI (YjbR/CyaY-like superfamily)